MGPGTSGKGTAIKAIFEAANILNVKAGSMLDSDLRSISPEWIELLIAPVIYKDIGFVARDMSASVKVAAYPFTRHGDLKGRIEWVGRDAVMDEQMGLVYPVRISVDSYQLPNIINGRQGRILPGMTVATDIKVGKRRVIHYFLGPMLRYKDKSLREL